MQNDKTYMAMALDLGRRMLGRTAPNPAVGCIIVKDGKVIGRGFTQTGGRPHAETEALKHAGEAAKGATAYVSLEPCAHEGKTGSCAQALIKAGVARLVAPMEDPDARVSGKGFLMLKNAGIEVVAGVLAAEAETLHEGFLKRVRFGRPMFTFKIATSIDGRVSAGDAKQRWISCDVSRAYAHLLRANHDAIMVGIGTALADNPLLTCRLPGLENRSPIRIVMDSTLRLPLDSQLVKTAPDVPLWIVTAEPEDSRRIAEFEERGVKIIAITADLEKHPDLGVMSRKLGELGLTRVMLEGGPQLASAFLEEGLIDRIDWVTASIALGGDAVPAIATLQKALQPANGRFKSINTRQLGHDRLESFVRAGV